VTELKLLFEESSDFFGRITPSDPLFAGQNFFAIEQAYMATADVIYSSHPLSRPSLTPRTPRFNLEENQDEPLLQSSASETFPQQADADDTSTHHGKRKPLKPRHLHAAIELIRQIPPVLVALLIALLVIIAVLYRRNPKLLLGEPSPPTLQYSQGLEEPEPEPEPESKALIDYSGYSTFPLSPLQYAAECWKMHQGPVRHQGYWDVPESGIMDVNHAASSEICSSTITYQLDSHSGLFAQLALLAQVAALARERGRTLFVDDKFWNRGKWTEHFEDVHLTQPGPEPGCKPPLPRELVACPRLARHWVVNSRTAKFHLGHAYENEYHDPYGHGVDRLRPVFEAAGDSMSEVIIPNAKNKALIAAGRRTLGTKPFVGVHIRRGDHKAMSWRYHQGHVPLEEYVNAITGIESVPGGSPPFNVWIASDDTDTSRQFAQMLPEGFAGVLLNEVNDKELRALVPLQAYNQSTWNEHTEDERIRETRGMIVDFAVISGAWAEGDRYPEAVICAMTSNVCTMAAVGGGWNWSFIEKRWLEIDNGGSIEPIWQAYTLF